MAATHSSPALSQLTALHHYRIYVDIGVVVVVLAISNLIAHFTTPLANVATVPIAALCLVGLARPRGMGWAERGLGQGHWQYGAPLDSADVSE